MESEIVGNTRRIFSRFVLYKVSLNEPCTLEVIFDRTKQGSLTRLVASEFYGNGPGVFRQIKPWMI